MIKINIIAVGKLKEKYLTDACAEYLKRLKAFAKVEITQIDEHRCGDNPSENEIKTVKDMEGEKILSKISKGSFVIAMCIEGTQLSSEELAKKFESIMLDGNSEITIIIGGSFGLSDKLKSASDMKLSFGKITLPHQLMRVVLLEQIYRAFSIINNSKYHK
ncbi:MAG: 23S rRNA (pseudouridine(1915)-N(3))-methyltransferase RlmH [Ruminococcaceae bacterium]|nr:23S rRNA (pseudouridine(1915)-N(3))-methyltransferase RlmH [Oscillospiraceae bacterium]